jgi:hypothetical protein
VQPAASTSKQTQPRREALTAPMQNEVVKNVKDGTEISFGSNNQQRVKKEWVPAAAIPDTATALELEAELKLRQREYLELEEKLKKKREESEQSRQGRVGEAQVSALSCRVKVLSLLSLLSLPPSIPLSLFLSLSLSLSLSFSLSSLSLCLSPLSFSLPLSHSLSPSPSLSLSLSLAIVQMTRRLKYEEEDRMLLERLQSELEVRQKERDYAEKQRRVQLKNIEKVLVEKGIVPPASDYDISAPSLALLQEELSLPSTSTSTSSKRLGAVPAKKVDASVKVVEPVPELAPMRYDRPPELPKVLTEEQDVVSKLDRMLEDEHNARKRGTMTMEEYETVKFKMAERQLERDQRLRQFSEEELNALYESCALAISRVGRGYNGRKRYKRLDADRRLRRKQMNMVVLIQKRIRGIFGE